MSGFLSRSRRPRPRPRSRGGRVRRAEPPRTVDQRPLRGGGPGREAPRGVARESALTSGVGRAAPGGRRRARSLRPLPARASGYCCGMRPLLSRRFSWPHSEQTSTHPGWSTKTCFFSQPVHHALSQLRTTDDIGTSGGCSQLPCNQRAVPSVARSPGPLTPGVSGIGSGRGGSLSPVPGFRRRETASRDIGAPGVSIPLDTRFSAAALRWAGGRRPSTPGRRR